RGPGRRAVVDDEAALVHRGQEALAEAEEGDETERRNDAQDGERELGSAERAAERAGVAALEAATTMGFPCGCRPRDAAQHRDQREREDERDEHGDRQRERERAKEL